MTKWRYITGERESATRGLAGDEFLMNQYTSWAASDCPEPTLRLYTFRNHGAIIGRFQNLDAEVDVQECRKLGVAVNRRVTGGGAVLMGEDQLMIAVASSAEHPMIPSHPARILPKMARGMISGLAELGIKAEYRPKNDVVVGRKKIAGTALSVEEFGAFLYQASLIVDFDIALMLRTLKIPPEKISDKRIKTFGERITTLNREMGRTMDMRQVREAVCRGFERAFRMSAMHSPFTPAEMAQIESLERGRYMSDAWIHQRQPALDMLGQAIRKTPAGLIHVYITLAGDMVKSVLITGDFFSGERAINDIEAGLKWGRTDRESIARTIRVVMASSGTAIQGLDPSELADIIAEAAANARHAQTATAQMANA